MNLTKQERKVYNFILANRGCTTIDIQRALHIECPSARITGLRHKGVKIISIGKKRYPGAHPFEMYAIEGAPRLSTPIYEVNGQVLIDGKWVEKALLGAANL